jgi:hypothetical protein
MTEQERDYHFESIVTQLREILLRKGSDYATSDVLSNFKLAGSICGLTSEKQCLSLIATKVARLGVLLSSDKPPTNESIDDSAVDLIGYSILLSMLLKEQAELIVSKPMPDDSSI